MALGTPSHVASEVLTFSGTSTSSASVSFANNTLYLMGVTVKAAASSTSPTSITGGGMTWVKIDSAGSATLDTSLWRALVTSGATSGALTFNWASTHTEVIYTIVSVSGADTSGTNGSGAIVQSANGNKASSTTFANTDMPQLAALGSVNNGVYAVASHVTNEQISPGGGWAEVEDAFSAGLSLSNRNQQTEWALNKRDPSWSAATASNWRGVSAEIKASAGGGGGGGGGSVIFGIWCGGTSSGFGGPSNDTAQLKWYAGTDNAAKPWAGNTGLGRNPGMVRWRGGYGQGGNGWSVIKDVGDANYWAARGAIISTNIKMTTGTGGNRTEAPLQSVIDGDWDGYLAQCATDMKAVQGEIYMELFSESNVAHNPPDAQPAATDGPWPESGDANWSDATHINRFRDWCKHIVNYFDNHGVTNCTYVLSLAGTTTSVWGTGGTKDAQLFIEPLLALEVVDGKRYIDVIGVDCYTDGDGPSTNPPARNADDLYRAALNYRDGATGFGGSTKPLGVFETGVGPDTNGSGNAGTGSSTSFVSKATWYPNVGEWITTNQAKLACVVFNIAGAEKYPAEHDNGNYSFNNASWAAFKTMSAIGVFTGATTSTMSGTATGTATGLGTLTAPGASAATLSGTAEGTGSGLGTLSANTLQRHRTRRAIPDP